MQNERKMRTVRLEAKKQSSKVDTIYRLLSKKFLEYTGGSRRGELLDIRVSHPAIHRFTSFSAYELAHCSILGRDEFSGHPLARKQLLLLSLNTKKS